MASRKPVTEDQAKEVYVWLVWRLTAFGQAGGPTDRELQRCREDIEDLEAWGGRRLPQPLNKPIPEIADLLQRNTRLKNELLTRRWDEFVASRRQTLASRLRLQGLLVREFLQPLFDFRIEGAILWLALVGTTLIGRALGFAMPNTLMTLLLSIWFSFAIISKKRRTMLIGWKVVLSVAVCVLLFGGTYAVFQSERRPGLRKDEPKPRLTLEGADRQNPLGDIDGSGRTLVLHVEGLPEGAVTKAAVLMYNDDRTPIKQGSKYTTVSMDPVQPQEVQARKRLTYTVTDDEGWSPGTYYAQVEVEGGDPLKLSFTAFRKWGAADIGDRDPTYSDEGYVRGGNGQDAVVCDGLASPASFAFDSSFAKLRKSSVSFCARIGGLAPKGGDSVDLRLPFGPRIRMGRADRRLILSAWIGTRQLSGLDGKPWGVSQPYSEDMLVDLCFSYDLNHLRVYPRGNLANPLGPPCTLPLALAKKGNLGRLQVTCTYATLTFREAYEFTYNGQRDPDSH